MCAVSMISDYYSPRIWPHMDQGPVKVIDEETKNMLRDVVKRLDEIDQRLKDRDCMDEKKAKFLEWLNER